MRPLIYSINVTLDGCVHHNAVPKDEALMDEQLRVTHRHATATLARCDALLFGRVTYGMMEGAWRLDTRTSTPPDWTEPFARAIDPMKKYVVSSTLDHVEWNSELFRGDLGAAVEKLKQQPGGPILTGGVQLPLALAELDLIDEYQFVLQPRIAGHGPTPFAGISKYVELKLIERQDLPSGALALRYEPRR
jgi:dihydrofolate reductase